MELYFKKLLWPSLVIALVELIFVQSQPHWLVVTLGFAFINAAVLLGLQFVPRPAPQRMP
jgi:hypothetical protein